MIRDSCHWFVVCYEACALLKASEKISKFFDQFFELQRAITVVTISHSFPVSRGQQTSYKFFQWYRHIEINLQLWRIINLTLSTLSDVKQNRVYLWWSCWMYVLAFFLLQTNIPTCVVRILFGENTYIRRLKLLWPSQHIVAYHWEGSIFAICNKIREWFCRASDMHHLFVRIRESCICKRGSVSSKLGWRHWFRESWCRLIYIGIHL